MYPLSPSRILEVDPDTAPEVEKARQTDEAATSESYIVQGGDFTQVSSHIVNCGGMSEQCV